MNNLDRAKKWIHVLQLPCVIILLVVIILLNSLQVSAKSHNRPVSEKGEIHALMKVADPIKVTGKVTDKDGNALIGVTVKAKNGNTGTVTDTNGNYTLEVDDNAVLVISYVGYETKEVSVNGKSEINIKLSGSVSQLNQLVVVGYGTQKKKDLTGSISTISSETFEKTPSVNPLQAVSGRVPGISISQNSGLPGSGFSVNIRGIQSINGTNSPIYVVDGAIKSSIDNINPNDIESISVLKDASSTAIYGARAANGVVIVTTKRGTGLKNPEITFNSYVGVKTWTNMKLKLLNSQQYLNLYSEAYKNDGVTPPWTEAEIKKNYTNPDGSLVNTDWLDLITRTGLIQHYDLSVAGGSDNSNYYVSGGAVSNKGRVIRTRYDRYNLKFNSDHTIADWIHFGNSVNLYASTTKGHNTGSDNPYVTALTKPPITRAFEEDGDYGKIRNTSLEHQYRNPIWMARNDDMNKKEKGLTGNVYLKLDLLSSLNFTTRGSLDWQNTYNTTFMAGVPSRYGWEGSKKNQVAKENENQLHWIADFTFDFNKKFGDNHSLHILAGSSLEKYSYEYLSAQRDNTPSNSIRFLDAGDPTSQFNGNGITEWSFFSLFGRLNYSFKDKYLLTANIRRDGTSRLSENNRFGVFPSLAVAWRLSEEPFMQDLSFLNNLKVRLSWGKVGNVMSLDNYATIPVLTSMDYVFNEKPSKGYSSSKAVNQGLRWESTNKKDIGIDASLLDNRLYSTIDFFIDDTHDLLFQKKLPESAGYVNNPFINAGHVRNSGLEFQLGYRKKDKYWNYDFSLHFTHTKNKVISLGGQDLHTQGLKVGYPANSFFGYETNGLIYTKNDLNNYPHMQGKQVGDLWYKDINGVDKEGNLTGKPDGKITPADRALIGRKYPDITYGAYASVGYKNWTLQVQLQGVQGIDKNILGSGGKADIFNYFTIYAENNDALLLKRFHSTNNPKGNWPRLSTGDTGHNVELSEFWLRNASYLKIKNINLNYSFPDQTLKSVGIKRLEVYIGAENLYTFTSFPGPSVTMSSGTFVTAPPSTTLMFGLNITF